MPDIPSPHNPGCWMRRCPASSASRVRCSTLPACEDPMTSQVDVRAPAEQTEGTRSQVLRWLKQVGDAVAENEPLIEIETDKVTVEVAAPAAGTLAGRSSSTSRRRSAPGSCSGISTAGAVGRAAAAGCRAAPRAVASGRIAPGAPRSARWRRGPESGRAPPAGRARPRARARSPAAGRAGASWSRTCCALPRARCARRRRCPQPRWRRAAARRGRAAQPSGAAFARAQAHRRAHGAEPAAHRPARHDGIRGRHDARCWPTGHAAARSSPARACRSP